MAQASENSNSILPKDFKKAVEAGEVDARGEIVMGSTPINIHQSTIGIKIPAAQKTLFLTLAKANRIELDKLRFSVKFEDKIGSIPTEVPHHEPNIGDNPELKKRISEFSDLFAK